MHVPGFIALSASILALAACGGGDDEGSPGAPGTTQKTKPATTQEAGPAAPTVVVRAGFPLRVGRTGARVEQLQRALAELGYRPGEPDAVYGEMTRRAVVAFQRRAGLPADGVVGTQTARALNKALAERAG